MRELNQGLKHYFQFYNNERGHQSLSYRTPAQVYYDCQRAKAKKLQIQMVDDPPYFCQFLVLILGVTI